MNAPAAPARSLLIVDDDQRLARMLEWSFDDLGYAAWTAGSLAEAGDVVGALQFDYALLDLRLPDGSGAALGQRLLHTLPDARIALMSADKTAAASAVGALRRKLGHSGKGRVGWLGKPVRPGQVDRWFRSPGVSDAETWR